MLALLPGTVLRFFDLPYCPGSSSIIPYCSGSSRGGGWCGVAFGRSHLCTRSAPSFGSETGGLQGRSRWRSNPSLLLRFFFQPTLPSEYCANYSRLVYFCQESSVLRQHPRAIGACVGPASLNSFSCCSASSMTRNQTLADVKGAKELKKTYSRLREKGRQLPGSGNLTGPFAWASSQSAHHCIIFLRSGK